VFDLTTGPDQIYSVGRNGSVAEYCLQFDHQVSGSSRMDTASALSIPASGSFSTGAGHAVLQSAGSVLTASPAQLASPSHQLIRTRTHHTNPLHHLERLWLRSHSMHHGGPVSRLQVWGFDGTAAVLRDVSTQTEVRVFGPQITTEDCHLAELLLFILLLNCLLSRFCVTVQLSLGFIAGSHHMWRRRSTV